MSKIKKVISFLFVFVFALSSAAGCSDDKPAVPEETNEIMLNSFENTKQFETSYIDGILGKLEISDDKAYVKDGEKSGKVTVVHNPPYYDGEPVLFQSFYLGSEDRNYTDFSHIAAFSMEIFNTSSLNQKLTIQLSCGDIMGDIIDYDLAPNAWTGVRYLIEREYLPKTSVGGKDMLRVEGVIITFTRPEDSDVIYYVDSIKLHKTDLDYQPYAMILEANEICSFDNIWQCKTMVTQRGFYSLPAPIVEPESEMTSTGKGRSVKITAPTGERDCDLAAPLDKHWPGVGFNREMTKLIDFKSYPPEARLCFDVYSPKENGVDQIWFNLYAGEREKRFFSGPTETLVRDKWVTISYSVAKLNSTSECTEDYNFGTTTYIAILWMEHTGPDRILYLDNFRMEL